VRIGYARVSSIDQNLAAQLAALELAGCEFIYREKASGKDTEGRPELQRLLDKIRPNDVLVVTKLDRLARSTPDLLNIFELVARESASILSLSEPWADTTSPAGTLIITVMAGIAQFERARILERCNEGRRAAKLAGRNPGPQPKLKPEQQAELLKMLAAGRTVADVTAVFGISRNTLFRIKAARRAKLSA
jgi:DNA invertase Pin-like site-specific DNA recombinase